MIFLEEGPSSLVVDVRSKGQKISCDESKLQRELREILASLKEVLPLLKIKGFRIRKLKHLPWVAREMIEACQLISGQELTPMAAVAGAVADALKERLVEDGFDYVMVNNGGDISLYTCLDQRISVAIKDLLGNTIAFLYLKGPLDIGIATSGMGGRSLTKGILDSVTVISKRASVADAAATFIGTMSTLDSEAVRKLKASELDRETDLGEEMVCVGVGDLTEQELWEGTQKARRASWGLKKSGAIYGSVIRLKGKVYTDLSNNHIKAEVRPCL